MDFGLNNDNEFKQKGARCPNTIARLRAEHA
jgi:hypothetical protein